MSEQSVYEIARERVLQLRERVADGAYGEFNDRANLLALDTVATIEALAACVLDIPSGEPEPIKAHTVVIDGVALQVPRGNRKRVTPDDVAKARAFDKIAAFVGASGREAGGVAPHVLLNEVGIMLAMVNGVPNPNADDTERFYRAEAVKLLSAKQLRMIFPNGGE